MRSRGRLNERDERLALSVVDGKPAAPKRQRRRRCATCGLQYTADELVQDFDEEGRKVGLTCENCY